MTTTPTATARPRGRTQVWRTALAGLLLLTGGFSLAALTLSSPATAAPLSISQCNNQGPGPMGATTGMTCTVTVVNTISGGVTSSTTTVSRQCSLDPCAPGNGSSTTSSSDLVTTIAQCNGSDNDAAHPIDCNVTVTNNISADTPGALPVTAATVNQCNGSAGGGGGSNTCAPVPATTTSATVTQCNGSANGGGGTVNCNVDPSSTVSPAIPISVNQCNGTGNAGGAVLTCRTTIRTNITAAAAAPTPSLSASATPSASPSASPTPTPTPSPSASSSATPSVSPSASPASPAAAPSPASTSTPAPAATPAPPTVPVLEVTESGGTPQISRVPRGGVAAGGGSTAGLQHVGLLKLGAVLLIAAGFQAAPRRRTRRTAL